MLPTFPEILPPAPAFTREMPGLYVHLPFCAVHCTYCPFAVSTDLGLQDRYVDALAAEVAARAGGERPAADTLYFGGGTPSRTSPANLARLTAVLREQFDVDRAAEFTLESNPEDVTPEALEAWLAMGVNRISIGVQSFNDAELSAIGRIHDAAQARKAIALAAASGVRTSVDLIAGLPQQSAASFADTLSEAIGSGVGHVSLYMLDLEETTPLQVQVSRGRTRVPEDEIVAELYAGAIDALDSAGFAQYEISNFARDGEQSRHNLAYWNRADYHGFGISAHSLIAERRFANTRNIRRYLGDPLHASDFEERLGEGERRRETIFLRLRQASGISYEELVQLCGQEGIEWQDRGLREGWLRRRDGRVGFTPAGFLLSNEYISQLF